MVSTPSSARTCRIMSAQVIGLPASGCRSGGGAGFSVAVMAAPLRVELPRVAGKWRELREDYPPGGAILLAKERPPGSGHRRRASLDRLPDPRVRAAAADVPDRVEVRVGEVAVLRTCLPDLGDRGHD